MILLIIVINAISALTLAASRSTFQHSLYQNHLRNDIISDVVSNPQKSPDHGGGIIIMFHENYDENNNCVLCETLCAL